MKKGLLITSAFALLFGVGVAVGAQQQRTERASATASSFYFDINGQSELDQGNEKFAAWYWKGSGEGQWADMTRVGSTSFYSVSLDASAYDHVIFARLDKTKETHWDNKWHQTANLDLSASKNCYKATGVNGGDVTGEWTNLTESNNEFYVYDKDGTVLGNTLANINVYGFGQGSHSIVPVANMEWPGVNTGISAYEVEGRENVYRVQLNAFYSKFIINCGDGNNQTVDVEDLADHLGDVLVIGSQKEGKTYNVSWMEMADFTDFPANDGYYLAGTESSWKFEGATLIPSITKDAHNNVAILHGYEAKKDEEVRVRSYFEGVDSWKECVNTTVENVGSKVGDNFVFSQNATVDVFVFDDGGVIKFSVAKHVELLTVGVVNRYFSGATLTSYDNAPSQDCVKGEAFTPAAQAVKSGYVVRGYYTDSTCKTPFVNGTVLEYDTTIYAKYTKVGYYVLYGASEYSIDTATIMNTEGIDAGNKAEAIITVAINDTYSFAYYNSEGEMEGHSGLGDNLEDYAVNEDSHIKFVAAGTYAVYWSNSNNKIYLNPGKTAFCTNFISVIGGICKTDNTTNLETLATAWEDQAAVYNGLSAAEKKAFTDIGFNGGKTAEQGGTLEEQVIAKYHYIVWKYGSEAFDNFIFGTKVDPHPAFEGTLYSPINTNGGLMATIIVIATISAIGVGVFVIVKKKHN